MNRRELIKAATTILTPTTLIDTTSAQGFDEPKQIPQQEYLQRAYATDPRGSRINIPVKDRDGKTAQVFFTRDLSAKGLRKIYAKVNTAIIGRTAVKLHTGERDGPNILPCEWIRALLSDIPDPRIVEYQYIV